MCLGYAYAQLNKDQHTKYCTAGDDSITESHTMENGVCKYCGYAPAKTYSVTVTDGSADHGTNVAPGTKVTLTANTAPSGQEFDKWAGNVTVASDTTFTMPASAVKIEATYKDAPPSHTHSYGTEWKYDGTNHWHECECGDKADTAAHSFQWVIDKAATKEATKPFSALYRQHRGSVLVKDVNGAEGPAVDCQRFPVLLGRIATSVIIGVRLRDNGLRQTIADESLYPRPGDDIRTVLFSGVQLDCNLAGQPAADLIKQLFRPYLRRNRLSVSGTSSERKRSARICRSYFSRSFRIVCIIAEL